MAAFVFNTPLIEETQMTSDQEHEDDVSMPDCLAEDKKEWFTHFVIWQRKTYRSLGSKLDPDKVHQIEPTSEKEAGYLNFLMFHDKCRANVAILRLQNNGRRNVLTWQALELTTISIALPLCSHNLVLDISKTTVM